MGRVKGQLCYSLYMFRKTRIIVGVIFIALILAHFLYDPLSFLQHTVEVRNIQSRFVKAHLQWDSAIIQHYSFEIRGSSQDICMVNALIEVQDNKVILVQPLGTSSPLSPQKWADPDWGNEVLLCDYNHFTVPQIFAMLGKTLENSPFAILDAEFDPQYGFVTQFEDGIPARHGWLNLQNKSVYNEFQVSNFKIEQ